MIDKNVPNPAMHRRSTDFEPIHPRCGVSSSEPQPDREREKKMPAEAHYSSSQADDFEPFEVGVVKWVRRDDDVQAGLWIATPEQQPDPLEITLAGDETIYLLEGRIRVEVIDGPVFELSAGDMASFRKGTTTMWTVIEPVKEFFVLS